jgi:hypothetical protein
VALRLHDGIAFGHVSHFAAIASAFEPHDILPALFWSHEQTAARPILQLANRPVRIKKPSSSTRRQPSNERPHCLEAAVKEYERLLGAYPKPGYETIVLPKVDVAARADLALRSPP